MDLGAPQGFIGVDIANTRHDLLIEQSRLNLDIALEVILDCCFFIEEWIEWVGCDVLGRSGNAIGYLFY